MDVQGSPKSGNETGNTGYPKVYIFLMKKSKMITSPGSNLVNLDLTINIEYKKLRRGSQIMVGFIIKTKAEKANTEPAKLFPFMISFKTTSENTNSEVSKALKNERTYYVLDELNVQPGVGYMTKITNTGLQEA